MTDGRNQKTEASAPDPLVAEALTSLRHGYFADAREKIRTYAATHKRGTQHYLIEGLASLAMADWPAAQGLFRDATAEFPDNAQFWFNRGLAEENLGQLNDAEASYRRSLGLKPNQGEALGNLSNILRKTRRFPEAVQMACRALAANAPKAEVLNVLALALGKQGNFSEAEKALKEAASLAPDDVAIHANHANLAIDQLKFDEAWDYFAEARALDDSAIIRRDEGMARLLAGDYAKGLPLYESRLELPGALRIQPACPRWQGENLAGKTLLLVSEQGFGDTIQFCRYADKLADAGTNLIWGVRRPLQRLLAMNMPGKILAEEEIIVSRDDGAPLPLAGGVGGGLGNTSAFGTSPPSVPPASGGEALSAIPAADFWLPILSLPFVLGMIAPMAAATAFRAPSLPRLPDAPGKRKIGLVWSGSTTHERDHERSIPPALLTPILEKIDAQFYAPFKGAEDAPSTNLIPLDPLIHDFADTAALISQLDCLITVDTAAAHLAGALGIPTYLLLPHCPDWRWGAKGETTSWYGSMTLLRQPSYGDWGSVIESLLEKLA